MKHKWKPVGFRQWKYCEAECIVCSRAVPDTDTGGSAFWCDTDGLVKFWEKLNKLNDCKGNNKTH